MKLIVVMLSLCVVPLLGVGCAHSAPTRTGGTVSFVDEGSESDAFVIQRRTIDHALEMGAAWFVRQLKVRPIVTRDERFFGFQLIDLFPGREDTSGLLIKTGDIIQRINGHSIERPDQFMSVWHSLATASHQSIQLMRGNQHLRVTWTIREPSPAAEVSAMTR
jgi:hypothetical protein